jgi:hypothetical protein
MEDEMDGHVECMVEMRDISIILIGKKKQRNQTTLETCFKLLPQTLI